MGRVAYNDAGFDGVGEDAAEKVRVAVPAPPRTMAFPRGFLVLTETRVFPAMMSLRTLLTSVLARSLTQCFAGSATRRTAAPLVRLF